MCEFHGGRSPSVEVSSLPVDGPAHVQKLEELEAGRRSRVPYSMAMNSWTLSWLDRVEAVEEANTVAMDLVSASIGS